MILKWQKSTNVGMNLTLVFNTTEVIKSTDLDTVFKDLMTKPQGFDAGVSKVFTVQAIFYYCEVLSGCKRYKH